MNDHNLIDNFGLSWFGKYIYKRTNTYVGRTLVEKRTKWWFQDTWKIVKEESN